jgi:hypothetical protein
MLKTDLTEGKNPEDSARNITDVTMEERHWIAIADF